MNDTRPILFFDSGVGGLSVLDETRKQLPQARFIYAADSAGFPYGARQDAEIAARVPALLGRLTERYRPRLIVIACNTASTIALAAVRAALDLPIVGTVPAIKPAAEQSLSRVIGVLGTEATVRQRYVDDLAARYAGDCRVLRHGSATLAGLAEARLRGEAVPPSAFHDAVVPLFEQSGGDSMDIVVNACTHFPLVTPELMAVIPHRVRFIDGAAGIARRVAYLTRDQQWPDQTGDDIAVFTRWGDSERALTPALERHGLHHFESI